MYMKNEFMSYGTVGRLYKTCRASSITMQFDFRNFLKESSAPYQQFVAAAASGVWFGPDKGLGYSMWMTAGLVVRPQWYIDIVKDECNVMVHGFAGNMGGLLRALDPMISLYGNDAKRLAYTVRKGDDMLMRRERLAAAFGPAFGGVGSMDEMQKKQASATTKTPIRHDSDPVHYRLFFNFCAEAGMARTIRGLVKPFWKGRWQDQFMEAIRRPFDITWNHPASNPGTGAHQVTV